MKMVLVCHLQHAVALLLYASLTTDVKLTERLFWTTTQMKRVYWPVRREAPWSVWRSSSPRPGGQTLQTLSGVCYETARPLDQQNTPQTALIERPVKKPVCVWRAKKPNSLFCVTRLKYHRRVLSFSCFVRDEPSNSLQNTHRAHISYS